MVIYPRDGVFGKQIEKIVPAMIDGQNRECEFFAGSDNFFRTIVEGIPDAIYVKNKSAEYVFINKAGAKVLGKKPEEFIGKKASELFSITSTLLIDQTDARVLNKGETISYEETLYIDGEKKIYLSTKNPCFDQNHTIIGLIGISKDITERKEIEKRKDDFFGIASHELKTPVTTIKAFTQLLQQKFKVQKDLTTTLYLSRINHQVSNLTTIIEDLLDVSRIQRGKLLFKKEIFSIDMLTHAVIEDLQLVTVTHAICIEGKVHANIYGDKKRIVQVLTNLVINAVKFSPGENQVIVYLKEDDKQITIQVKDFGIGMQKEEKKKIFDKFYRVDRNKGETFPGLGIGLHISREIIKRHNGELSVESQRGNGSTFSFTLPIKYSKNNMNL